MTFMHRTFTLIVFGRRPGSEKSPVAVAQVAWQRKTVFLSGTKAEVSKLNGALCGVCFPLFDPHCASDSDVAALAEQKTEISEKNPPMMPSFLGY